ncbi:MAG: carbohydrate ABC transporter permease [Ruthenibacterium sp.]
MNGIESSTSKAWDVIVKIFIVVIAVLFALPLYIVLINVFKTSSLIVASPFSFPIPPTLDNLKTAIANPNINLLEMYGNSFCITFFGAGFCLLFSSMAGYYVARSKSKLAQALFLYFILGLMVPYAIVYVPLVSIYKGTFIVGTLPGLICIFISGSLSFAIFMYQGFVRGVPIELEEAATIDGANQSTIFFRVIFPLLKPCTAAVAIFTGVSMWNDFLTPLLIGQVKTITVGIYTAIGPYSADWGSVFAYVLLATIFIVVAYIALQKQFISGLVSGAVKG